MSDSSSSPPGTRSGAGPSRILWAAALLALFAFHAGMNTWWLMEDNHTIRTDEEGHMHWARKHYEAMFLDKDATLMQRAVAFARVKPGNPAHPPLLHIIGAVTIALFGYGIDTLAAVNTAMFLLTLIGCLLILLRFLDRWRALFTVFVISFLPILYASSRYFMTDYVSLPIVVWALYALIRSERFRNTGWVFAFSVLNGLGFLARSTTFLYYLIPCLFVVLAGWVAALTEGRRREWRILLFNCLLTAVVTAGIFSPWYFRHLDDFYHYWVNVHAGGVGGPVALLQPETPRRAARQTPEDDFNNVQQPVVSEHQEKQDLSGETSAPAAAAPAPPRETPAQNNANTPPKRRSIWEQIRSPRVNWGRYPMHALHNAVFLPTLLLCLVGMALAFLMPKYRSFEALMLLLWLLGSWVCMTITVKYATARYILPAAPAIGVFAALAVTAPGNKVARRLCTGIFTLLLLFQYGNLTVRSYGPLAEFSPDGMTIWKDYLTLGFSYTQLSVPQKANYKNRLFLGMVNAERQREFPKGEWANYLRLRMRGMEFDEVHYWRELPRGKPNPFRIKEIPADELPVRRLRSIGFAHAAEELLPVLDNADYIVYAVDLPEKELEAQWILFFLERGFQPLDRFEWPAFGEVPDRLYGVLERIPDAEPVVIAGVEDVDKLNWAQLYELRLALRNSTDPRHEAIRTYVDQRFEEEIAALALHPQEINEHLSFLYGDMAVSKDDWYVFRFIFKVNKAIDADYRIFFHGSVDESQVHLLPPAMREQGFMMWNFDPVPPTSQWPENDYVLLKHRIRAEKIKYGLKIGFYSGDQYFGTPLWLGEIDFGALYSPAPAPLP